ncbi:MAG: S-layer homology domain-containing protein [Selenomonas sp.]|uniref:S-layer homology domain-containing protein n=1 Tax=Selenomonas sp. TaxID=2053611 RepID=UPI0025F1034B|nr:S-layer homology domain-containing protein [Selenomonas sp.]MCR5439459.1 S-layer homology domain-containing protein [Selenomonas sp.]
MKKQTLSLLTAMAITAAVSGQAMAAPETGAASFTDVPAGHWSYAAIDQLVKDGVLEGNGDGTFAGNRSMSRYEMAAVVARAMNKMGSVNPADQALLEKLEREYHGELSRMDERMTSLEKKVDKIQLSGFVRAKYDHDSSTKDVGSQNNNKHFYMNLEGRMKVGNQWEAHFQSETRKGYTVNQSWRKDAKSDDQDGTFQRIWVEGQPTKKLGAVLGTKWWGYGYQNVIFGHAADGANITYNFTPQWSLTGFGLRPRQGDLVTMPDGEETHLYGANITGRLGIVDGSLTYMSNKNYRGEHGTRGNQMMSRAAGLDLRAKVAKDVTLYGTYVRTNAYDFKTSKEFRVDYRDVDSTKRGDWGLYARYIDFGRYGDVSHDDEWGSLPKDTKGYILGVKYIPWKDVVWETFYSDQKYNHSGSIAGVSKDAKRHLFRTQFDFHF